LVNVNRRQRRLMALGVACLAVVAVAPVRSVGASGTWRGVAQIPEKATVPPVFTRVCGKCHEADRIAQGRRLKTQWEEVVDKMAAEGAVGSDDDFAAVLEYLVTDFGRVNVNAAPAEELAKVMHLEPADAEKIVAYRKIHGKFEDFAALVAMPGAPVDALTKRRDALLF
jgi:hypothetical protein